MPLLERRRELHLPRPANPREVKLPRIPFRVAEEGVSSAIPGGVRLPRPHFRAKEGTSPPAGRKSPGRTGRLFRLQGIHGWVSTNGPPLVATQGVSNGRVPQVGRPMGIPGGRGRVTTKVPTKVPTNLFNLVFPIIWDCFLTRWPPNGRQNAYT